MLLRIEEQMWRKGISREQLAGQMGLSRKELSDRLEGRARFSLDEAMRLKAALQTEESIENLFRSSGF